MSIILMPGVLAPAHAQEAPRLGASQSRDVRAGTDLPLEERVVTAARIYAAMKYQFAHGDGAPGVDLEAAYRVYVAEAVAAPDRRAFAMATQAFLARFRNGHTLYIDRALIAEPAGRPVGFALRRLDEGWVVTASQVAGLQVGDVVAAIDGQPVSALYAGARPYLSASTERWAERLLFEYVPGIYSGGLFFPLTFTLTLEDGRIVRVDRSALPDPKPMHTEGRWLEAGRVGYIRIPSFAEPQFEAEAVKLVEQYTAAEALIIDVRGNTGGSTPTALHRALMDRPYRWWAGSTPMTPALYQLYAEQGNGWFEAFRQPQLAWPARTTAPDSAAYAGRVVLVVDAGCHSACEDFVMPFADNGRGVLVGTPTAGSTGQPALLDFGDGRMALIGAKRERFPDGAVFEGVGIMPDEVVPLRASDVKAGQDAALERARRLARRPQ